MSNATRQRSQRLHFFHPLDTILQVLPILLHLFSQRTRLAIFNSNPSPAPQFVLTTPDLNRAPKKYCTISKKIRDSAYLLFG